MNHCIIAKFNESAADKQAALAQVRALLSGAEPIEVEMEKAALPNWDASRIHHQWKEQFGGLLEKKAIFDYED